MPLARDFMYFDDITIRVVEENLLPTRNRCFAPIRIGNALFLKMRFESGQIICAIGNVTAFKRVHDMAGAKSDLQIRLSQVGLDVTI